MKINVYRLRGWKEEEKVGYQFDFEFKDEEYQATKERLRYEGFRIFELFAWN